MGWIGAIIIGGIAGWLAGKVMRGGGFGVLVNVILGILGGVIGNWLISILPFLSFLQSWGVIGSIIIGFIGAAIILAIAGLFKRS
ncbi:MAG TPA: GlsB/YeaQ/YmgE family stress response membrane protein [Chloroflexi bacterium]|nr:GlsB/YeaQ/YmgE family stress response membrane protein [Chloroflexota bacterium]HHW84759.1 GlsB/YeaQ/YmgE family stress response membrane protein [Chloroflexota bacterium]